MSIITHWNKCMYMCFFMGLRMLGMAFHKRFLSLPSPPRKFPPNSKPSYTVLRFWHILGAIGLLGFNWQTIALICLQFSVCLATPHLFSTLHYPVYCPGSDLYALHHKGPLAKRLPTRLSQWEASAGEQRAGGDNARMPWLLMLNPQISVIGNKCSAFKAKWDQGKVDRSRQDPWRCEVSFGL